MNKKTTIRLSLSVILLCLLTAIITGCGTNPIKNQYRILCLFTVIAVFIVYVVLRSLNQKSVSKKPEMLNQKAEFLETLSVSLTIISGTMFRCAYVLSSGLYERQHDAGAYTGILTDFINPGHIGYTEFIYKFGKIPDMNPYSYFGYFHPPVHYVISAIWVKLNTLLGVPEDLAFENLQIMPLIYSCLCLILAYKIFKLIGIRGKGLNIALLLVTFHPSFIIMSGSINNDMLTYLLMSVTIYSALLFIKERSLKSMIFIALSIGFGMLTKLNSVVIAFPVGLIFLINLIRVITKNHDSGNDDDRNANKDVNKNANKNSNKDANKDTILEWIKRYILFAIIVMPIGLSWILRNIIRFGVKPGATSPGVGSPMYTGAYNLWERVGIPNLANLRFDFPFHPLNGSACHNIWAIMMHTSLFAEEYPTEIDGIILLLCQITFAIGLIVAFITAVWLVYITVKMISKKGTSLLTDINKQNGLFVLCGYLSAVISFAAFGIFYPYTCSSDFRYMSISLLFIAIAVGLGNEVAGADRTDSGEVCSSAGNKNDEISDGGVVRNSAKWLVQVINIGLIMVLILSNLVYMFWGRW